MAPEQERAAPPAPSQDTFSFGCLLILLLTACDPQRILARGQSLSRRLKELSGGAHPTLIEVAVQCVSVNPTDRLDVGTIVRALKPADLKGCNAKAASIRSRKALATLEATISQGARGILGARLRDEKTHLWLSGSGDMNPITGANRFFELRRDAHHGVCGIVYTLARLVGAGCLDAEKARPQVVGACQWLIDEPTHEHDRLPGLYFGDGGVAVALQEARRYVAAVDEAPLRLLACRSTEAPLDWTDVTHGAAGQGITGLLCESLIPNAREVARRIVRYLAETQEQDGSWKAQPGVEGLSGQKLTGFAHGCAGIVYYLAACHDRFGFREAEDCWQRGAEWLMANANPSSYGNSLVWPYSMESPEVWKWWCHGSPGISLTFLKLFHQSGQTIFADFAIKALNIHNDAVRSTNLSICHGLAGLGEIYLEAALILDDRKWRVRAEAIASTLLTLTRRDPNGSIDWLVEDPYQPTADLMVGSCGVLHFLSRLRAKDPLSFPFLPSSIRSPHTSPV